MTQQKRTEKMAEQKTDPQTHWVIDEASDWRSLGTAVGLDMPERGALPYGPIMSTAADKGITFEIGKWRVSQTGTGAVGEVYWTFKAPASGSHPGGLGEYKASVADVKRLVQEKTGEESVRLSRDTVRKAIWLHFGMEDEEYVILQENKGAEQDAAEKGEPVKRLGRPRGSKNKPKTDTAESGE